MFVLDDCFTVGTGVGKSVWFYATMAMVFPATAVAYWINRHNLKHQITDWLVPVFTALALALTYTRYPLWNTEMYTLMLLTVLYFVWRIVLVQQRASGQILLIAFMATGLVEAIWGLLQLYGYAPSQHTLFRATGSFFNPGPYAGYLVTALPMALYYALRGGSLHRPFRRAGFDYLRRGIALATLVCTALILPATMSRAAWLAAAAGCAVVLMGHALRNKTGRLNGYLTRYKKAAIATLAAIVLLACIGVIWLYHLKKDSADGRALIWKVSMELVGQEWPFGSGLGYFAGSYGEAQQNYFAAGHGTENEQLLAGSPEYAFNEFIQLLVELGPIPLIFMLIVVGYAGVAGIRRRRWAEVGSLVALLVFSCLSYPFSLMPFLVIFTFLIAACVSVRYRFTNFYDYGHQYLFKYPVRRRWNHAWIIIILLVSGAVTAWCLFNTYPVYLAHKQWGEARPLYHARAYEKVEERYRDLQPYLEDQAHNLFEYGQALSKTERYEESVNVIARAMQLSGDPMFLIIQGKNYMALHDYRYAIMYFNRAAQRVPHRLYPHYMMAKAYLEAGDADRAWALARQVVMKPVKVESPATREMKTEMEALIKHVETGHTK